MELKSNGMTNEEYQQLIEGIRKAEEQIYGISLNVEGHSREQYVDIVSNSEWLFITDENKSNKKINFKVIKKVPFVLAKFTYYGLFCEGFAYDDKAHVALNIEKSKLLHKLEFDKKHSLVRKIFITFHEIKHLVQETKGYENMYQEFSDRLSRIYKNTQPSKYFLNHDKFYFEIDANWYAIKKTEVFLKQYPDLYEQNKDYINKLKSKYEFDLNNFDLDETISSIIKENIEIETTPKSGELKDKNVIWANLQYALEDSLLQDIMDSENNIGKKELVYSILSNHDYIRSNNLNNLSEFGRSLVDEALQWKKENLQQKITFNNEYLAKNNHNLFIKLKVTKANQKLETKIRENELLYLYVQQALQDKTNNIKNTKHR